MSETKLAVMPLEDYENICNSVRAKTGETELIKSGEVSGKIDSITPLNSSAIGNFTSFFNAGLRMNIYSAFNNDFTGGTNYQQMFYGNKQISDMSAMKLNPNIGAYNTKQMFQSSSVTISPVMTGLQDSVFSGCTSLVKFNKKDDGYYDCYYAMSMFYGCTSLEEIDLGAVQFGKADSCFANCKKLKKVTINFRNSGQYGFANFFNNCEALEELYLTNISKSLAIGSGTTWGHLLTIESLVRTIQELRAGVSATLTIGSANLEKIANVYCRVIDDTDTKKTMELCESTDEGAMLLEDYALLKGWLIQ